MTHFTDALTPSPHQGTLIVYTPPLDAAYFCATQRITSVVQRELIAAVGSPHTTDADTLDAQGNGHGKYTTSDGTSYEGGLLKWQPHGWGKFVWPDRVSFEGDYVNNKKHGSGKYTKSNGICFEGDYADNLKHGPEKMTLQSGAFLNRLFVNGISRSDPSNLTNLAFIQLLFGTLDGGLEPTITAEIFSDFLKNGYEEYAFQIDRAMQFMISPAPASEMLYQTLNDGQIPKEGRSFLLCSGYREHAIGLNIIQESRSPNLVYLEIFNSGEGLDHYHIRRGEKFQTRLQARAALENITPEIIKQWMDDKCHNTIHDVYKAILDLPKSQVFDPAIVPISAAWALVRKSTTEIGTTEEKVCILPSVVPISVVD